MPALNRKHFCACCRLALLWLVSTCLAANDAPRAATHEEAELLFEALEKTARDLSRWAYTETRVVRDEKGNIKSSSVVRHDPSKPYAEQFLPIAINGKAPGEKDFARYRRQGMRVQKRDEALESGRPDRRPTLGELIDPRSAKVISARGKDLVFEVPLLRDRNDRFPPDKFEVHARVDREQRTLQHVVVRLREAFRSKLVLKVKSGGGEMEFTRVDPNHAPTLTAIRGDASASVLFVSVGGELELTRTELKRVKPYKERFDVQIGTIRALDF